MLVGGGGEGSKKETNIVGGTVVRVYGVLEPQERKIKKTGGRRCVCCWFDLRKSGCWSTSRVVLGEEKSVEEKNRESAKRKWEGGGEPCVWRKGKKARTQGEGGRGKGNRNEKR